MIKVISINLNKCLGNPAKRTRIEEWLNTYEPDLLLTQEPFKSDANGIPLLQGLKLLSATLHVACWVCENRPSHAVIEHAERWQEICLADLSLHNVYFPSNHCNRSDPSKCRCELLSNITRKLKESPKSNTMFLGDFNLGPQPEDGRHGDEPSNFTSQYEREAFRELLTAAELYDATHPRDGKKPEFTIERKLNGQYNRFRCDLALPSRSIQASVSVAYDHSVRIGTHKFTDHSAIIVRLA